MIARIFTRARLIGLALAIAIAAVDQWLKYHVTQVLGIDREGEWLELLPFFDLRFTRNFGVSLGMLEATSPEMRWGLVAMTAGISLIVLIWMIREKLLGDILPLALVLGGAIGNIRDRYSWGYVVDYADLHFGSFRPFLIFNLADAAITVGVVIILARALLFGDKRGETDARAEPASAETP